MQIYRHFSLRIYTLVTGGQVKSSEIPRAKPQEQSPKSQVPSPKSQVQSIKERRDYFSWCEDNAEVPNSELLTFRSLCCGGFGFWLKEISNIEQGIMNFEVDFNFIIRYSLFDIHYFKRQTHICKYTGIFLYESIHWLQGDRSRVLKFQEQSPKSKAPSPKSQVPSPKYKA